MRSLSLSLMLAAALSLPLAARATVVLPVDLETLARRADVIVKGRVRAAESRRSADGKQIHTVTRVEVASAVKGEPARTIEVRTRGGTIGDLTQVAHGEAELVAEEEVYLFLRRAGEKRYTVESHALGKFSVQRGPDGVERVVQRVRGLAVLERDGRVHPAAGLEPADERAFLARVRRALEAKEAP